MQTALLDNYRHDLLTAITTFLQQNKGKPMPNIKQAQKLQAILEKEKDIFTVRKKFIKSYQAMRPNILADIFDFLDPCLLREALRVVLSDPKYRIEKLKKVYDYLQSNKVASLSDSVKQLDGRVKQLENEKVTLCQYNQTLTQKNKNLTDENEALYQNNEELKVINEKKSNHIEYLENKLKEHHISFTPFGEHTDVPDQEKEKKQTEHSPTTYFETENQRSERSESISSKPDDLEKVTTRDKEIKLKVINNKLRQDYLNFLQSQVDEKEETKSKPTFFAPPPPACLPEKPQRKEDFLSKVAC